MTRFPVLIPLLLIGACASQTCDPHTAGLFTGMGNQLSGCYDQGVQTQEAQLRTARENLRRNQDAASRASADMMAAQSQHAAMQGRFNAMISQEADLRRRVAGARDRQAAEQERQRLDELQRQREAASQRGSDPAAMQQLENQYNDLAQRVIQLQ